MIGLLRMAARALVAAFFLIAAFGAAHAAGALAVGTCGAYGYGYDFRKVTDARAAAMRKCTGNTCKVVGIIRRDAAEALRALDRLRGVARGGTGRGTTKSG